MNEESASSSLLISCIIPTCDRPLLLRRAVDSVLGQTSKPLEVIVVNNGRLPVDLASDAQTALRVVEAIPYFGVAQARNVGAILARGEYLAFLDDDDAWPPEYLETIGQDLAAGAQCVLARIDKQLGAEVLPWKNPGSRITPDMLFLRNTGAGGSNIVVSRRLFYEIGGYDPALLTGQDKGLVIEILLAGHRVDASLDVAIAAGQPTGRRQTDHARMSQGKTAFFRKYRRFMRWDQRLGIRMQIEWYRWRGDDAGRVIAFLKYLFLRSLYSVTSILRWPRSRGRGTRI